MSRVLNVAVEGCCHGELDTIYAAIAENERRTRKKVDLLLVCGDFECVRDIVDLECLAVPQKYRKLNSFHQYVTGEKIAPVTTIFVGGNHEASNVLQSLYYGGWVAPKIYFLGFGGVVNFRGLRIAGLSGIFNQKHYRAGEKRNLLMPSNTSPFLQPTLTRCTFLCTLPQVISRHRLTRKTPCAACTTCASSRCTAWPTWCSQPTQWMYSCPTTGPQAYGTSETGRGSSRSSLTSARTCRAASWATRR